MSLPLIALTTFAVISVPVIAAEVPPTSSQDLLAPVMAVIAGGETGADPNAYRALYGGGHFGFPQWEGRAGPAGISHAAGKYQFQPGTWKLAATEYISAGNPVPDFRNDADQEAVGRFWAQRTYKKNTGRNLVDDAAKGAVDYSALAGEWSSLRSSRKPFAPKRAPKTAVIASQVEPPAAAGKWNVFADGAEDAGQSFLITGRSQ